MDKAREDAEREEAHCKIVVESPRRGIECYRRAVDEIDRPDQLVRGQVRSAKKAQRSYYVHTRFTKSGFVYVISNIGSFGEHIFKIGMTRRLEPTERIDELGSALFRSHSTCTLCSTLIMPLELETALHQLFEERRINLIDCSDGSSINTLNLMKSKRLSSKRV